MTKRSFRFVLQLVLMLIFVAPVLHADTTRPLRILRVNPSGKDVPAGKQIVLQFDRAVVPIGRMERNADEIPVEISPDPSCQWRWINTSALACQLGEKTTLLPSTRYDLVMRPGITTEDGTTLATDYTHTFTTQRPKILYSGFSTWTSPGTPVVRVTFNQRVTQSSVQRHLAFRLANGTFRPVTVHREERWSDSTLFVTPDDELPVDEQVALVVQPGVEPIEGNTASIEDREIVVFNTFPEFRFLGVQCENKNGKSRRINAAQQQSPGIGCDPLGYFYLLFSSPVISDILRDHLKFDPDLAGDREDYDPWQKLHSGSQLSSTPRDHIYKVRLPETLRAFSEYRLVASADGLRDEFNRTLASPLDFRFRTHHRRPRLHLGHNASVLESEVETHLPVIITNLDAINVRIKRWAGREIGPEEQIRLPAPQAEDIAFRFPLKTREWLDGQSGAVVGHASGVPSTGQTPTWFFSQVTPFQVHVKVGHYNTLVWVTDLADGRPLEGANIKVTKRNYESLSGVATTDGLTEQASAVTNSDGLAVLPGTEILDPSLSLTATWRNRNQTHLFVEVEKEGELALVPLARDFMVHTRGFVPVDRRLRHGHLRTWGVTAQGIYRAGDTVQYKIYIRNEGNEKLQPAAAKSYKLTIVDPMGKTVHSRVDIELNSFGALDGDFTVPETGAVGWYRFELRSDYTGTQWWQPLQVLISDFTPAPFRVTADLNGEQFADGETVEVGSRAALHSGGPYVDAEARISAILRPAPFRTTAPAARGFAFDTGYAPQEKLHQSNGRLDGQGILDKSFIAHSEKILYGNLAVESAVRDDRGKYVVGRSSARFAARDRFVGIRQDDWVLTAGGPAKIRALVADALGEIATDIQIDFKIEQRKTQASRVKGAGNAYLTHYIHSWVPSGACSETSSDEGVTCRFTPESAGLLRLTASIVDTQGRPIESQLFRWVTGRGVVLWEQPVGHQLEILPEKETLRIGDTARYLVKNPFPGATAMITIERFGVIKSWLQVLPDSTSIIEFPVEPDHLPGFYLSVVVVSPRVEKPPAEDNVDLGKPSFRVGYVRSPVRDPYKELEIVVEPADEVYKPRDRVVVDIHAQQRGDEQPEIEFAVAVLDEAVLDLLARGTKLFDPYEGFYSLEGLDMLNFNLLTRLIGIQKFEKKGANPGGGGGLDPTMRSQFKFVSYWNPSLRADAEGHAQVEFEVPDNLTGWRVLVLAVTPGDHMGLGQGDFRVNRPTELRPALPNQLIEGDRFKARFTVMNRTDRKRSLAVTGKANGSVDGEPAFETTVEAEPYKRYPVSLPIKATAVGEIRLEVQAGDRSDADGLVVSIPVNRKQALETAATYGTMTENEVRESLQLPDDIRTDIGRISVVASPTVIGGLEGAFTYLRDYPYICWEQLLSKGVMAAHYQQLRPYLPEELEWSEAAVLVRRTLDRAANFQAPNGGMAYYTPRDTHVSPYLSAYTALAFHWLRDQGHVIPEGVEERLHGYLQLLLRKDVFPTFYSIGMGSSVRAVALAALAPAGKVTPADIERYRSHVPQMDLFGKAHYLQALNHVRGMGEVKQEVLDLILSHANESGGKLVFTEQLDDGFARILHSELRTSCAVLNALVSQNPQLLEQSGSSELPFKIVRTITQSRKQRNHWENTQENIFCMNALVDYRQRYEKVEPRYSVQAHVDGKLLGATRFKGFRNEAVEFERPIGKKDPGRQSEVRIRRKGAGRLYYAVRMFYSPLEPKQERINSGIEARREYSVERDGVWVKLVDPFQVQQGELVRVDLYVSLPNARNFVVVDDPIPGGLEPVNRDLATASTIDADKTLFEHPPDAYYRRYDDWHSYGWTRWSFYHKELRHDSARFYSEYLPAGRYHLSYVAQVIASGEFTVLPLHVEEMYDPDVFGQGLPATLSVGEPLE